MLEDLLPHRDRIAKYQSALLPDVHWDGTRRQVSYLSAVRVNDGPRAEPAETVLKVAERVSAPVPVVVRPRTDWADEAVDAT